MKRVRASLNVAEPCSESWESMHGNARSRHCAHCDKHVHNLASMDRDAVEDLAFRQAMGESICARVTRDVYGEIVTAPETRFRYPAAGVILSAALAAGVAQAQSALSGQAVLSGRLVGKDGEPIKPAGQVWLRQNGSVVAQAPLHGDGSFEIKAAPGVYDIQVGNVLFGKKVLSASLHEGAQSLGDVKQGYYYESTEAFVTLGGIMGSSLGPSYWVHHPLRYAKYLGYRVRRSFSD